MNSGILGRILSDQCRYSQSSICDSLGNIGTVALFLAITAGIIWSLKTILFYRNAVSNEKYTQEIWTFCMASGTLLFIFLNLSIGLIPMGIGLLGIMYGNRSKKDK